MDLFEENDYRKIIKTLIKQMPRLGHGQVSKMAQHLNVNTTLVSQVLNYTRNFTEEQALLMADYLGFNKKESYYFVLLVQFERAGTEGLKNLFKDQIKKLKAEANKLKGRVDPQHELNFGEQAVYYSHWGYAATHTLFTLDKFKTRYDVAQKLNLDITFVSGIIDQLIQLGLLVEEKGVLSVGSRSTYLPADSPLVVRHHQNWRQVSSQQMIKSSSEDFYFTAPFSISNDDYNNFRLELIQLARKLYKVVEGTKPEELACLNLDLFKL